MPEATPLTLEADASDAELLRAQTRSLLADAEQLDAQALAAPSRCAGWTRAHVLAHLAGNARAVSNLVTTVHGTPTPMYSSQEARDEAIEEGARLGREVLLADLRSACEELAERLTSLTDPAASAPVPDRDFVVRADQIPALRLREVVYHHVDLDCGYSFADAPTDLVRRFLDDEVDDLRSDPATPPMSLRTNERDRYSLGDGRPVVSASRAAMLAWLARGDGSGIDAPPAEQLPALPHHSRDAVDDAAHQEGTRP